MPEIHLSGPAGRLEGRYVPGRDSHAPVALLLHPHPQSGGTMNHKVIHALFHTFSRRGFAVLRFNFRGVGRSQGRYDRGEGELADAAAALDWLQSQNPHGRACWLAGLSFGAWIGMQLLMRRPEIDGFVAISPPANLLDFSFLAPSPCPGLILHGGGDEMVPGAAVEKLIDRLSTPRENRITYQLVAGATHYFQNQSEILVQHVETYLDACLAATPPSGRGVSAALGD